MAYSNSPLVTYTKISPNRTSPRNHKIDRLTIHCYVGQVTAERGCNGSRFVNYNPLTGASCNYVVGWDGTVGLCVEEKDRSWCSSNKANDHRAITIECASATYDPYEVTESAYKKMLDLVEDICRRNGIKKLVYIADNDIALSYEPKDGEMLMTFHRWFKNKACPGNYLMSKMQSFSAEINRRLSGQQTQASQPTNDVVYYIVQKGDTLSAIARKYGTTYQVIAKLNGIASPYKIFVGQKIRVK